MGWSYFRIGAMAFGGGLASLPVFRSELCERRGWLAEEELAGWFGAAQTVPGVVLANVSALTAMRLRGRAGAVVAVAAAVAPALLCMAVLGALWVAHGGNRWVAAALRGLRPAVVALLGAAAVRLAPFGRGRNKLRPSLAWVITAGAAAWILAGLSPVPVLVAAMAGPPVVWAWRERKARRSGNRTAGRHDDGDGGGA